MCNFCLSLKLYLEKKHRTEKLLCYSIKIDLLKHHSNTADDFMSEGNKQAPISSGWWYDLTLSFCISLLSAAACRLSHALVAGVKGTSSLLSTQNTATFFLPPIFVNLRGSVWSPLLKTAYLVISECVYVCVFISVCSRCL